MSGLWGFALADPRARADISELALMGIDSGQTVTPSNPVHALAAGPAAFAAQDFPHRSTGTARREVGSSVILLAVHGTIFDIGGAAGGAATRAGIAEALLEGFLERGSDLWSAIRGEFVIAVWDGREAELRLVSDRFRVHPLYYRPTGDALVFGSRLAPLLAYPRGGIPEVDPDAMLEVLVASVIPTPGTIYQGTHKLPAGTELTYRSGTITLRPYWDIRFRPQSGAKEQVLAQNLRTVLADSMQVRLDRDRDASYGAFLSGGIDSTTVLGLATRIAGAPVKSFSIGFGEPRFNEMEYARIAARAYRSEHHEHYVQPADVVQALPTLLDAYDEPFGNASSIATYYCALAARQHGVDVLYAGDGGDELFAGNERYSYQRQLDYYAKVPAWIREPFLRPAVQALAATRLPLFVKGAKYIHRARMPYPDRYVYYGLFSVIPFEEVIAPEVIGQITVERNHRALMARYFQQAEADSNLDRELYTDLKLTIGDNDLVKVVKATEAAGVAARFPFLDHHVADFAGTVPAGIKMRGTQLRSFFKRAYATFLPPETIAKTKHGFGLPISDWLRTDPVLHDMMRGLVLDSANRIAGYFQRRALETLVERHRTDPTTYYGGFLWNLMVLELWLRRQAAVRV